MKIIRKLLAELIGTFVLVFMGCGTAMLTGPSVSDNPAGYLLTALAFGLTIVAMAYCVGNVSGCHINPAVSLGVLLNGGMKVAEFIGYLVAQCVGALLGAGALVGIFNLSGIADKTGGIGSNGLAGVGGNNVAGLLVEVILTCLFVLTILGVTDSKAGHGSFGGLIIGLTLFFVHIFGIGFTGTSVNPARSLGPAVVAAISGNTEPISQLWIFIVAPLAGAVVAVILHKLMNKKED